MVSTQVGLKKFLTGLTGLTGFFRFLMCCVPPHPKERERAALFQKNPVNPVNPVKSSIAPQPGSRGNKANSRLLAGHKSAIGRARIISFAARIAELWRAV